MKGVRFLQTGFWADFKAGHGWKSRLFLISPVNNTNDCSYDVKEIDKSAYERSLKDGFLQENQAEEPDLTLRPFVLSVMTRSFSLKFKRFTLAYIPMATESDGSYLTGEERLSYLKKNAQIAEKIKAFLPENTVYIRFDFPLDFYTIEERENFIKEAVRLCRKNSIPFRHSKIAVQPPDTSILDITKSEEELLSGMKNKWRYNVRLASKKGVTSECYDGKSPDFDKAFDTFYSLFEVTSKRDGVSFHGKEYYRDLLLKAAHDDSAPEIKLYLAKHEEDYIAGIITLFCKREAVYLYGSSANIKRNLMAPYLLQWTAITDAKKAGCPCYDFYGMPPDDNPAHPMHGLYLFKTGFGGTTVHRSGSWDYILKPFSYRMYSLAEKMRAWFFRVLKKRFAGR
ncbi:MAG: peptidoglycan bridge formation glycyltransferase FemA/FemB family protein [Treponema sp.]|nr:peptidoglycan bridge formation glycyltransferase FemA/FemB family protein [Treponema sp.]